MSASDPVRHMMHLCMFVVFMGAGGLLMGLSLYRWHHAVDVGVDADHDLLDRLNGGQIRCSGMNIESYANDSLAYHQAISKLYRAIANAFLLVGTLLVIAGALQLRTLRTVRNRLGSGGER